MTVSPFLANRKKVKSVNENRTVGTNITRDETQPLHKGFSSPILDHETINKMYLEFKRMPLEKKPKPTGQVFVVKDRCKSCDYCVNYCPEDVLELSDNFNSKGYTYPNIVEGKDQSCVLCNMCSIICPEFAIFTKDTAAEPALEVIP